MDFIERIFAYAPDGGSGSLELLLILTPIIAVAAMSVARLVKLRTSGKRRRSPISFETPLRRTRRWVWS